MSWLRILASLLLAISSLHLAVTSRRNVTANDDVIYRFMTQEQQICFNSSVQLNSFNCSCSRQCYLYNTCCSPRYTNASYFFLEEIYKWPVSMIKWAIEKSKSSCWKSPKTPDNSKIYFSPKVPTFQRSRNCKSDVVFKKRDVMAPTSILQKWPVIEARTGLVFDTIDNALCHALWLAIRAPNGSFTESAVAEFWPSFRIICRNNRSLQSYFEQNFDPFDKLQSSQLEEADDCGIELLEHHSRVLTPSSVDLAYCQLPSIFSASKEEEDKPKPVRGRYLMSFRLLMDFSADPSTSVYVYDDDEIPFHLLICRYVVLACLILSIVSLGVMILVYSLFLQLRNLPGKVTMCLSSTLFVALTFYSIGVLGIPNIRFPVCFCIAVAIHFCFLASFFFGTCLAFDIWRTFNRSAKGSRGSFSANSLTTLDKLFVRYNMVSWGIPAAIIFLAVTTDFATSWGEKLPRPKYAQPTFQGYDNEGEEDTTMWVCWMMNQSAVIAYFNVPIGLCLSFSAIFFVMTIVHIGKASATAIKANAKGRTSSAKKRLVIYLKLSTIMGLTWLFGLVAAFFQSDILWLIYAICNSLQGFYICLSFVCTRRVTRMLSVWFETGSRSFSTRRHSSMYSSGAYHNNTNHIDSRRHSSLVTTSLKLSESKPLRIKKAYSTDLEIQLKKDERAKIPLRTKPAGFSQDF